MAKSPSRLELFRAVEPAEARDLQKRGGRFRNPVELGLEAKYFATTQAGARDYARQAANRWALGPFTIVRTSLPAAVHAALPRILVDGRIEAIVVPTEELRRMSRAVMMMMEPTE